MKITKKRAGIAAAVLTAAGITAAGAGTAFAEGSSHQAGSSSAGSPAGAAFGGAAATVTHHAGWGRLRGRAEARLFLAGGHGERTVKDKTGAWVTREWQVGTVSSNAGGNVVVTGADGTTWTWSTDSATKVRAAGKAATLADVKVGDEILVTGTLNGSAHDAKAIADPGKAQIQKWEQARADRAAHRAQQGGGSSDNGGTTGSSGATGSTTQG
jgi:hypothetical protein